LATRKQKETAELLRREISNIILYELSDPRPGFLTLTRLQLAGDYRSAKVFVTVRGSAEEVRHTLEALRHAHGHIQALIAERLTLRYTPVLEFLEDVEMNEALRVNRLIDEVCKPSTAPPPEQDSPADQAPDAEERPS